ncbi:hypothetical protein PK28_11360 [Hymenobacter sp. DG25B]|uniref:hypothetical protein n=1 Tax=Hymenobacter sp. DG25B TaxID=1385664 RepID=UPI0005411DC2|nr:hypothetical protein [Hymenobacter sp. DG25B]AIZ64139.1 hypothetical protein PK28_11360 [Hymenobacter sp. DG25B]
MYFLRQFLCIACFTSLPVAGFSQQVIHQGYTFLGRVGKMTRLLQSHDTLYIQQCNRQLACTNNYAERYRILASRQQGEFQLLQVESLDSLHMTPDPYPLTRFSMVVLRNLTSQQVGYNVVNKRSTRQQVAELQISLDDLRQKFYFTFFSDTYLTTLRQLPTIKTMADAERIKAEVQQPEYTALAKAWEATDTGDLYATGLAREILNRACIKLGFSPWLSDEAIITLLQQVKK